MAYQMDFYAGIEEKVLASIGSKVQYPAYVFVRDDEESETGRLAFVDKGNVLRFIRGENKQQVMNVTELPDVANGDAEVLYIMGGIVYVFDGKEYRPMYKDHTAEIEALDVRLTSLEGKVNAFEQPECLGVKVKYEISHKPIGTLVDYREKEIRVMCPADTVWTKQNVGATGNANMYYMGFKAYAPDDAVSFKEDDQATIEDQTMYYFENNDFAGIDEYGRKYSIVWLALASYDEAADAWTYFGSKSSLEKYIGWYYSVEWYNEDGILIASDCIRINLTNEECHGMIEPYYMNSMNSEIQALKDENASLKEQVSALEESVEELEGSNLTFVELE